MSSLEGNLRVIGYNAPSKDFQAEGHCVSKSVGPQGIMEDTQYYWLLGEQIQIRTLPLVSKTRRKA